MMITCQCGKSHTFTNRSNYNRALRGSGLCNGCSRKGKNRTPEQRLKISEMTKLAMSQPEVHDRFVRSFTQEVRRKHSRNASEQMKRLFRTDAERLLWEAKVSGATKLKWNTRPPEEQEKIRTQISLGRRIFSLKMMDPEYKKNHVRKTLCSGKTRDTKPEKKVKAILEIMSLPFEHPYQVEDKVYDFFIPSLNLLIEVDGIYWHAKGLSDHQMNTMQRKHKTNDTYKTNLAQNLGFGLLRVWEDEIDLTSVTERILSYEQ